MSTSKMMTQESLTQLLTDRGWEVHNHRDEHNKRMEGVMGRDEMAGSPMMEMRKGISLHGVSPTGYTLSLQAGAHNYSEPRTFAEEYESLEFAMRRARTKGAKDGPFIRDYRISGEDEVVGWADLDHVMKAIEIIESWTPGNGPAQTPIRENPLWDLGD